MNNYQNLANLSTTDEIFEGFDNESNIVLKQNIK